MGVSRQLNISLVAATTFGDFKNKVDKPLTVADSVMLVKYFPVALSKK
jgi:hypothetical protein